MRTLTLWCRRLWAGVVLLAGVGAVAQAQTVPIGYPAASVCASAGTGGSAGSSATTPGRWWNPQRPGTGWDVRYSASGQNLGLTWYSYEASGRPVWYMSGDSAVYAGGTWSSDLLRVTWNGTGPVIAIAGTVAVTTLAADPTRMALRWRLGTSGPWYDECIQDFTRAQTRVPDANSTHSGAWYEPALSGYGINLSIMQLPDQGYTEIVQLTAYDTTGQPVWLTAQSPITASTPTNGTRTIPFFYTSSNYPGGVPNSNCASNCYQVSTGFGSYTRQYTSTSTAVWSVQVNATAPSGQSIQWNRPASGGGWVSAAKLGDVTQIVADRTGCTIPTGQPTCNVTVNWGVGAPYSTAYPFRRNLANNAVTALPPGLDGALVDPLPPGRFRYELRATSSASSAMLASSAQVEVADAQPTQVNQIGYPSATVCAASPTGTAGAVPVTPGLWWNPERSGTAWDLNLINSAGSQPSMLTTWYTYDAQKRPTWLYTLPNQIQNLGNGERVWWSTLYKVTWNHSAQTRNALLPVGEVSLRFLPADPTRAVVRWRWNSVSTTQSFDECISDFTRAATRAPDANAAYTGAWFEPSHSGYGMQVSIAPIESSGYAEIVGLGIYDAVGEPVWLQGVRSGLASPPANHQLETLALNYFVSPYPGGVPTTTCSAATSCGAVPRAAGSLARTYLDARNASANIAASYSGSTGLAVQTVDWRRPPSGVGGTAALAKVAEASQVVIDRVACTAGACPLVVNWAADSSHGGGPRVYRRQLDGSGTVVRIPVNLATGEYTDNLAAVGRYRYELKQWDNADAQNLALSADVVVTPAQADDWGSTTVAPAPAAAAVGDLPSPAGSVEVGSTAGQFRVDESGSATYQIPLYVAPATGGVAPEMALGYSSGGGDGILGVGFNLSGQSAITRCRKSVEAGDGPGPHPTIQFNESDAYCLDGQRLIAVGTMPSQGNATVYRTEIDGLANIIGYNEAGVSGGPAYWKVWSKDGTLRLYGLSGRSHSEANCVAPPAGIAGLTETCNGRVYRNAQVNSVWQQQPQVMSWQLSKIRSRDPAGGAIEFAYQIDSSNAEVLLRQVAYSGADFGVRPSAAIRFLYAPRTRPTISYMSGARVRSGQVLTDIQSYTADGALARRYEINYSTKPTPSGRPLLTSVRELAANGASYPPTEFTWSEPSNGFDVYEAYAGHKFNKLVRYKYGDINGDGRADLIWTKGDQDETQAIQFNFSGIGATGKLEFQATQGTGLVVNDNWANREKSWQVFDFNQDGRDDLMVASFTNGYSGEWRIHLSNGSGFNLTPVVLPLPLGFSANNSDDSEIVTDAVTADFNGDGLPDLMTPALENGQIVLKVRHMRRATQNFSCAAGDSNNNCPYDFGPPSAVSVQLPSGVTLRLQEQGVNNLMAFDANGDGRSDLLLSVSCFNACLDQPASRMAATSEFEISAHEPYPEGFVPPVEEIKPDAIPIVQHKYWVLFTHAQGVQPGSAITFNFYERWKHDGPDAQVSREDSKFRVTDINGDGLADVVFERKGSSHWYFQLNRGDGFDSSQCVFGQGRTCFGLDDNEVRTVSLNDYNGDGRLDFWVGLRGRSGQPMCAGQGSDGQQYYGILLGGENGYGYGASAVCQTVVSAYGTDWIRGLVDLDGDGQIDSWGSDNPDEGSCSNGTECYRTARHSDRWTPREVITEIKTGLGARTQIQYAPMNFANVHRRDYFAPHLTTSGRGSPVFDLSAPSYVVQFVSSSAPNLEQPGDPWARVAYRYAGAKAQSGSRGALGMRKVWSLDLQTQIETETEYHQAWPLTGRPKQTIGRYLGAAAPNYALCGGGPGSTANGDLPGCLARAPICNANLTWVCDSPIPAGSVEFSRINDDYAWRARTSPNTLGATQTWPLNPVPAAPTSVFVYQQKSFKVTTDLRSDTLQPSGAVKFEQTVFEGPDGYGTTLTGYDGNGNLLGSSLVVRSDLTLRQRVLSSFNYGPGQLAPEWVPGLLMSSSTTTTRNGQSKTRSNAFEYESYGAVKVERVQPGGSLSEQLKIFTVRNNYGQPLAKVTCSNHFSDSQCTQWGAQQNTQVPGGVIADPTDARQIRRYEAYVYDSSSRFVNASVAPFDSAGGAGSSATAIVTNAVLERNLYGEPTRTQDANGIISRAQHTALGRQYHSYTVGSGVSQFSRYDWCVPPATGSGFVSTVTCPAGAVYRVEVTSSGQPTQRSYYDLLGRSILSETQAYAAGQWTATATAYDRLGRSVQTSEPYFSSGASLQLCPSSGCSKVQYDILGRGTLVIHPDDSPSRPVRTSTWYYGGACTLQGSASTCLSKRVTNAKGQQSFEHQSVLGDLVGTQDAAGLVMNFDHDAHGNLVQVTRTPSDGSSAGQSIVTTAVFDDLGRRSQLNDPDMGSWSYTYNAAGELIEERNANGQCVSSRFDVRGRLVARADYRNSSCSGVAESSSLWQFDLGVQSYGLLNSEREDIGGTVRSFEYDSLKRITATNSTIGGRNYRQEQTYDQHSRSFQTLDLVFAAGDVNALSGGVARKLGVQYVYNAQGYQQAIVNAQQPADTYYEVISSNARGQVVEDRRGGNVALSRTLYFDSLTGRLTGILAGAGGSIQNLDYGRLNPAAGYDVLGNLQYREDLRTGFKEAFGYDSLNRLTSTTLTLNGVSQGGQNHVYDQLGNIMSKGGLSYRNGNYSGISQTCGRSSVGPHMVTRVVGASGTSIYCYDNNGNQTSAGDGNPNSVAADQRFITYAVHDKPLSVRTTGPAGKLTRYTYGPNREIVKRLDGPNATFSDTEVDYVGGVEVYYRPNQGTTTDRREYQRQLANYLIISLKFERQNGNIVRSSSRSYRFEEKLGSTDVLTDASGAVTQRMSFDVWGERRSDSNWSAYTQAQIAAFNADKTRKGYTGHEHVDQANLIHMGGRIYDPRIGRFLSADPLVQAPGFSQSFNRYSYVMNNPMNYVDPSGYSWLSDNWRTIAAIVVSFYLPGAYAAILGVSETGMVAAVLTGMTSGAIQTGTLKGALIGGFSAGMFNGINSQFNGMAEANLAVGPPDPSRIVGSTGLTTGQVAAKIAANATAGGVMSVINGGKFGHGFASAGFGEAFSPAAARIAGESTTNQIIASAIVGGTTSRLAGGKFANGAITLGFLTAAGKFAKFATSETDKLKRTACAISTTQVCVDDERGVLRTDGTRGADYSLNPEHRENWLTKSGMASEGSGLHMYDPDGRFASKGVRYLVTDISKIHDWMNSWNYNPSNGLYISRGPAFDSGFQIYSFSGMPVAGLATIVAYAGSMPIEQQLLYYNMFRNRRKDR